jgi:excinuclease UvrABC nuclease subunit
MVRWPVDWNFRGCAVLQEDGFFDNTAMLHCVVYALMKRGEVVYIGKSKKPLKRIQAHINNGKAVGQSDLYGRPSAKRVAFDGFWIRPCMLAELDSIEQEMINKYKPKYNVKHKNAPLPAQIKHLLSILIVQPQEQRPTQQTGYIARRL